jgi:hypothetical protein
MNVNEDVWRQVLDLDKGKGKLDEELEDDMSQVDEEEWDEEDGQREFVEDSDESDVGDLEDYSGSEFDEFDSEDEGQDFPSDLDVSDEDDEDEDEGEDDEGDEEAGSDDDEAKPKKGKGKAPAPAAGSKRKAAKEPKRAKRREYRVYELMRMVRRVKRTQLRVVRRSWYSPYYFSPPASVRRKQLTNRRAPRQRRVRDGDRASFARDDQQLVDGVDVAGRRDKRESAALNIPYYRLITRCWRWQETSLAGWLSPHRSAAHSFSFGYPCMHTTCCRPLPYYHNGAV